MMIVSAFVEVLTRTLAPGNFRHEPGVPDTGTLMAFTQNTLQ
jgi:hypothetical protein